ATTLSIIGTAGRDLTKPMSILQYEFMCVSVQSFMVINKLHTKELTLVSGGAAWADHVAVDLFLKSYPRFKLILYLPCEIVKGEDGTYQYLDNGSKDWRTNPGRTSNIYHNSFKSIIGRDTIQEIIDAKELGAVLDTSSKGFHDRNTKVSKSEYLVALTFAEGLAPSSGGTLDTWNKSKSINRYHFTVKPVSTPSSKRDRDRDDDDNDQEEEEEQDGFEESSKIIPKDEDRPPLKQMKKSTKKTTKKKAI
ncbi:hypothetical protein SAMD00019534_050010, partial [Acytostelium subglobosum LB1]|uniref:hypothetical protein n=1 Tax=Acytostelium subglobosum LB1 TaxID=1410327 RepID=UPI000644D959